MDGKRWFEKVIEPQKVLDEDGRVVKETGITPNAFWAKPKRGIEIKKLPERKRNK